MKGYKALILGDKKRLEKLINQLNKINGIFSFHIERCKALFHKDTHSLYIYEDSVSFMDSDVNNIDFLNRHFYKNRYFLKEINTRPYFKRYKLQERKLP